eukprot:CAMPEP_0172594864 /NCGR_PEP_ID=MMETSP1068-20121228/14371_1 /TAXON_ID=35684 /ORGANISM="Pseudopedinella elastica, Strain CCMP716" /LENGTH=104 /DNA_ID=CAMNT_0013393125 /DNA_START=69 /DNA_END=380 /DNA_ORIENTATION=+
MSPKSGFLSQKEYLSPKDKTKGHGFRGKGKCTTAHRKELDITSITKVRMKEEETPKRLFPSFPFHFPFQGPEPDAARFPSGIKATLVTWREWPSSTASQDPLAT